MEIYVWQCASKTGHRKTTQVIPSLHLLFKQDHLLSSAMTSALCRFRKLKALKCKPSVQLHCMLQQPTQMIEALLPLNCLVSCLVLHVVWSVHVRVCTCYSLVHACAYAGPLLHLLYGHEMERYTKHCNVNKMVDSSWTWSR